MFHFAGLPVNLDVGLPARRLDGHAVRQNVLRPAARRQNVRHRSRSMLRLRCTFLHHDRLLHVKLDNSPIYEMESRRATLSEFSIL